MGQVNQPDTLIDQLVALRREVAELRKKTGLGATGSARSREFAGSTVAGAGSGSGAQPAPAWIPVSFEKVRLVDLPVVTSSSFDTVWEANFARFHPFLELSTMDGCDEGTTGAGRIVLTDPATGAAEVVDSWDNGSGLARSPRGPYPLPGGTEAMVRVAVQYRRTGGAGNVYAVVLGAVQRPVPAS